MTDFRRHSEEGGAGNWGGDAYPAEEPQATADREAEQNAYTPLRPDYTVEGETAAPKEYHWSMTGTHISVSDTYGHEDMFQGMGHSDSSRPHAWGTVQVSYNWEALWEIAGSTMSLGMVEKRLRRYSKEQGWQHVNIIDHEGMPMGSMKVASVDDPCPYCYGTGQDPAGGGVGRDLVGEPCPVCGGSGRLPKTASDPGSGWQTVPKDWKPDDLHGDYSGADYYGLTDPTDEQLPPGPIPCSECGEMFPTFADWREHIDRFHLNPNREPHSLPVPVVDLDQPVPADFNTNPGSDQFNQGQRAFVDSAVTYIRQNFILAAGKNDMIPGPIPFVFDIENDKVITGHPGERHSDIKGQFTPGGVVEGLYIPNGKMQFRTDTDMPYTVRHMVQLWQSMHPELVVKSVEKLMNGKPYKLASANIAHKVRNLALADDAVSNVMSAIGDKGNVYVVGGAIRDTVLDRIPKDIDLMVQGIPMAELEHIISTLPGKSDITGKAFGVLRYKAPNGSEVEMALPRKEFSTGEGHKDFDVQADPYMTADEDLSRRDFTGNSMCVNLKTGELLDPFGGAADLKMRKLRTTWPGAFKEDPLRTVRALSSVSRHGLMPDQETMDQMRQYAPQLSAKRPPNAEEIEQWGDKAEPQWILPRERIKDEMDKIMGGDDPATAMKVARDTGVLEHIFPDMKPAIGFDQRNKHHRLPLDDHLLEVLRGTQELTTDKDVRLAAFRHDVGKPGSFWQDDDGWGHYYQSADGRGANHEILGADMTRAALSGLKYPNKRIDRVTHLVRHHMFAPFDTLQAATKRIRQVGADHIQDLLTLRQADGQGKGNDEWENKTPVALQRQLAQQSLDTHFSEGVDPSRRPSQQMLKSLAINGGDLKTLGIPAGPIYSQILEALSDRVAADPSINTRSDLLALAQQMSENPGMMKQGNILDPIRDTLDPDVFENPTQHNAKLKAKLADWVTAFVFKTLVEDGWPDPHEYVDLVLTGSLCTFQWGIMSDFDVSVWVDMDHFPERRRGELIGLMTEKCDGTVVPGTSHEIQCFVVDTKKFTQSDLYKPGLRSAWDIRKKEWIVYPERERVHDVKKEFPAAFAYAEIMRDKLMMLLKYDRPYVKVVWDNLHRNRRNDMLSGLGDFTGSNIAYKMVANSGLFPLISEATGEYIAKTASREGWMAPSYRVPPEVAQQLHQHVQSLPWPEGTVLHPPEKYHITGFYSPEGYPQEGYDQDVAFPAQASHFREMGQPGQQREKSTHALELSAPELSQHALAERARAQEAGIPVSMDHTEHVPHVSVATVPGSGFDSSGFEVPGLQFNAGPQFELHRHYDALKAREAPRTASNALAGEWE